MDDDHDFIGPDGYSLPDLDDFDDSSGRSFYKVWEDLPEPPGPDPFIELAESIAGERMEAEIEVLNAVERLLGFGATPEEIISLVHDRF